MHAGRARLGILLPAVGETMRSLLKRIVKTGDWISGAPLSSSKRLISGTRVTAQLTRRPTDLWPRSYQFKFSFEDPVEMSGIGIEFFTEKLPIQPQMKPPVWRRSGSIDPEETLIGHILYQRLLGRIVHQMVYQDGFPELQVVQETGRQLDSWGFLARRRRKGEKVVKESC
ncbi:hypothetical protein DL95DRAFT_408444 [Leptodontidium sp. 2 PMI_412]|nr:hypothetical protein DL95DRAFT_408444 [Leptodontidium sp. 2 PMI_412]